MRQRLRDSLLVASVLARAAFLVLVAGLTVAWATGSLTIPNTIFTQPGGTNVAPLLDTNYQAIANYINTRELTTGLFASRPAAGVSGRSYFATDINGGTLYFDSGTAWTQIAAGVTVQSTNINAISSLTLANNGTATGTFLVFPGVAASDDATVGNRILMTLGTTYTKRLTAWAVGSGLGCLDTGAVTAFSWYHVFLIQRTDTNVVDVLCSLSTSPSMPASYTKKRRLGSIRSDWTGTPSIYFFSQVGNRFRWATVTLDVNNATPGTAANIATVSTPNGIETVAVLMVGTANTTVYISELFVADEDPVLIGGVGVGGGVGLGPEAQNVQVMTDTAQRIRYRAAANSTIAIKGAGWIDRRGQE